MERRGSASAAASDEAAATCTASRRSATSDKDICVMFVSGHHVYLLLYSSSVHVWQTGWLQVPEHDRTTQTKRCHNHSTAVTVGK